MSDKLKFSACVRMGGEVYRWRRGAPTQRPIRGRLKLGEWLSVPTLFGRVKAKVTKTDKYHAQAESDGLLCWLTFAEDDRRCWTCASAGPVNMKVAVKIVE